MKADGRIEIVVVGETRFGREGTSKGNAGFRVYGL